jgi:3-phenylpropionate/trans-cinnamate dioxygenase ferredoxin reductase subunit
LGTEVVLTEWLDRVLKRVASEPLSVFFTERHRAAGVDIRLNADVDAFEVEGVRMSDGELIRSDAILVGVGALANDALARSAGLACDPEGSGGILVDETARTSDPAIYAIGDVTLRRVPVTAAPCDWKACPMPWNRLARPLTPSSGGTRLRSKCRGSGATNTTSSYR